MYSDWYNCRDHKYQTFSKKENLSKYFTNFFLSKNALKLLKEKEVAAHLQLSQSHSLLGAHFARRLKWMVVNIQDTQAIWIMS